MTTRTFDLEALDGLSELEWFTADEVSAMTKGAYSAWTLKQLARKEKIPASRIGREWVWDREDLRGLHAHFRKLPKQRSRR